MNFVKLNWELGKMREIGFTETLRDHIWGVEIFDRFRERGRELRGKAMKAGVSRTGDEDTWRVMGV